MANKKISELNDATTLIGTEQIPIVQGGATVKATYNDIANVIIPKAQTANATTPIDLGGSDYANFKLMKLSWSGATGTVVYTLPDATTNTNRLIRFISDSTFTNNTKVNLTPKSGQNLDGSSSAYTINKAYEGIAVWSDGTEWFVIQKKG